jgi:hypothetical protein
VDLLARGRGEAEIGADVAAGPRVVAPMLVPVQVPRAAEYLLNLILVELDLLNSQKRVSTAFTTLP